MISSMINKSPPKHALDRSVWPYTMYRYAVNSSYAATHPRLIHCCLKKSGLRCSFKTCSNQRSSPTSSTPKTSWSSAAMKMLGASGASVVIGSRLTLSLYRISHELSKTGSLSTYVPLGRAIGLVFLAIASRIVAQPFSAS